MTTVLLDTHVVHWWSAEPERLSRAAAEAISTADALGVADITWYELAWLASHGRIVLAVPLPAWLDGLASHLRTLAVTPAIAALAATLADPFPGDPADRLIFATAAQHGWPLVTKDRRLHDAPFPRPVALW